MLVVSSFIQAALTLLPFGQLQQTALDLALSQKTLQTPPRSKSIAIVGAGTSGLGVLKALLDLPEDVRSAWKIDLYEQRDGVGGIWLPDTNPPSPPEIPETALYPLLRTNTPHPTMTYPGFPFPPMTPLYPHHPHVLAYHESFAEHYQLTPFIHLNHTVLSASYDASLQHWRIDIDDRNNARVLNGTYDHLIVANGHNTFPRYPRWRGEEEWLGAVASEEGGGERRIEHSAYYRHPNVYENHTVVVVGNAASGSDMAKQVVPYATKVYHSFSNTTDRIRYSGVPGTTRKVRVSHFERDAIVFQDGTRLATPRDERWTVLLGTGYELLVPFLEDLRVTAQPSSPPFPASASPPPTSASEQIDYDDYEEEKKVQEEETHNPLPLLSTNTRYIHPHYQHIFASSPSTLPTNALAFIGLPVWIANAPSDYAQGLFVAHALANDAFLPAREDEAAWLAEWEREVRKNGSDPFYAGHRFSSEGTAEDYQDDLITYIRTHSPIPLPTYLEHDPARAYVEPWRRRGREAMLLTRRGWFRAEELGVAREFLEGARTEAEWVDVMERLAVWQAKWEREQKERGEDVEEDEEDWLY